MVCLHYSSIDSELNINETTMSTTNQTLLLVVCVCVRSRTNHTSSLTCSRPLFTTEPHIFSLSRIKKSTICGRTDEQKAAATANYNVLYMYIEKRGVVFKLYIYYRYSRNSTQARTPKPYTSINANERIRVVKLGVGDDCCVARLPGCS